MEELYTEPVSPTGQYFTSSVISVSVIAVLESEIPIDDSQTIPLLKDLFLPINPRFSSLMVKDKNGNKHWKKVEVKLQEHLKYPNFPEGKSPEIYEECLTNYLSKIALEEFPQSRPLWEIHIIKYPTKNAMGNIVFKLHHSLGDGFSLMGALLSCLQRADDPRVPLTLPSMNPTAQMLGTDHGFCQKVSTVFSGMVNTVVDFGWSLLKSSVLEDHKSPVRSGEDGVEFRPITITTLTFSLDQIKQIKASLNVSINDVVCGVVFMGIRMYMQSTNQELTNEKSTALVLLNTRNIRSYKSISEMVEPDGGDSSWGNRFAFLHVPLPKMAADPLSFVLKANKLIRRRKNSGAILLTGKLLDALRKFRGPEVTAKYIHSTLKNTSMTVSNIMGPVEKMALSNQPVKGLYFMVVGVPQIEMGDQRILIRHSGHWEGISYVGGDTFLVNYPISTLSYENVVREIQFHLGDESEYLLFYLTNINERETVKAVLKSTGDLLRMCIERREMSTIYVISRANRAAHTTQRSMNFQNYNVEEEPMPRSNAFEAEVGDEEEPESEEESLESEGEEARDVDDRSQLFESLTAEFGAWIREPGHIDRVIGLRSMHSQNQEPRDDEARAHANEEAVRNWLIPHVDLDTALPLGWIDPDLAPALGQLRKDGFFKKKDDLHIAVGLLHMDLRKEYCIPRSDKGRVGFRCTKGKDCEFKLNATQKGGIWVIKKYVADHTCLVDLNSNNKRQVPAMVLGAFYARRLITEGAVLKPKEMVDELRSEYGIQIDYPFALRARNVAIEMTYGAFDESYQRLPSYLYLLKEMNPGTEYDIRTSHATDRLIYFYLAFGPSIEAFQNGLLRPVIVVDGAHLKGKNKGTLFVAVTKDGNEQVFPLAIGFGPIENDESWTWFLGKVRESFGAPSDLLIVSDQHVSIRNAIESVFPHAAHGLCFVHLQRNFVRYGRHAGAIFESAAYAYRDSQFDEYWGNLRDLSREGGGIYRRLSDVGLPRWARCKCHVRRTSFMTSNPAETMNARLLWARRLPICAMIEVYRIVVEKWFDEHRTSALARQHELTEKAYTKMSVSSEWGRRYSVRGTPTPTLWRVEGEKQTYLVDLQNSTCECREFELDGIPCRHACAAIRHSGGRATDYVSHYFRQSTLVATYSPHIQPVPHPETWSVPEFISRWIVLPPLVPRQAGRPPMARARSAVEGSSSTNRQRCSRCGQEGHKRRSCQGSLPISGVDLNAPPRRPRGKKKCSICKSEEHTRPRCPFDTDA